MLLFLNCFKNWLTLDLGTKPEICKVLTQLNLTLEFGVNGFCVVCLQGKTFIGASQNSRLFLNQDSFWLECILDVASVATILCEMYVSCLSKCIVDKSCLIRPKKGPSCLAACITPFKPSVLVVIIITTSVNEFHKLRIYFWNYCWTISSVGP